MRTPAISRLLAVSCALFAFSALPSSSSAGGTPSFTRSDVQVEEVPYSVVASDLNRDGVLDLAAPGYNEGLVSVVLGNGDGTFRPRSNFACGLGAHSVAAGDISSDGIPDLLVANANVGTVSILLGIGDGSFAPATEFEAANGANQAPTFVALADFNADGRLDAVVAAFDVVFVRLGNGDGTFGPRINMTVGGYAVGDILTRDLNADGRLDLAVVNQGSVAVNVLLGNGDGTFQPPVNYPVASDPLSGDVADLNADGHPDLVISNLYAPVVSVLMGRGDGTFLPRTDFDTGSGLGGLKIGDFNADGIPDVATAVWFGDAMAVLIGRGDGTFDPKVLFPTGPYPRGLATGDLNRDGLLDLVVSITEGPTASGNLLSVFLNTTRTNNPPTLAQPANMTVNEGTTADQTITGTDPDGTALTFSKVAGPLYMTVATITQGTGTATGNIRLSPGFADAGTAQATVRVTDGSLTDDKSFTIDVINVTGPPVLATIANITVATGAIADHGISATDPDGDAITFASSGPTFMTVTAIAQVGNTRYGNIHLAPPLGTLGTFSASVTATANSQFDNQTFLITVRPNDPPSLAQPANMTLDEGATANQALTAADADGDELTFSKVAGPTYMTVATTSRGSGTATGNIHLAPGFEDAGTAAATVRASDASLTDDKSLTITINNVSTGPPVLASITNMLVSTGTTADQGISAGDPDGDAITFTSSGPPFMTLTSNPQVGNTRTGNIHLAPPSGASGTFSASVTATANGQTSARTFTITVVHSDFVPVLAQPANMTVNEGATVNQAVTATDQGGSALTFSKVAGPAFMTVTTTTPGTGTGTGNINLAPSFNDAGTYTATVRASNAFSSNDKSFTITVNSVDRAPVLSQPANMTVAEGATANQTLSATDPDGNALAFSKASGPLFMFVTTTTPGAGTATGNINLAPGFSDEGTYSAMVRVSDGSLTDSKSLTITVMQVLNRCPVADPDGPYSVIVGVPLTFDGTASFDPDGDPLTFAWDFGDGATAVGPTPLHTYTAAGTFTVTLTVTDNASPPCSDTATTTTTIVESCPATVFNGYDVIRLNSGRPTWFAFVEPAGGCYLNTDVMLSSFVLKYGGSEIPAEGSKTFIGSDKNGNGAQEIRVAFLKPALRTLFAGLPDGHNLVEVTIEANLVTGGTLQGTTQVDVVVSGSSTVAMVSPNPLNPAATLMFTTTRSGFAKVELFDVSGRLVRTILDERSLAAGVHEVTIEGRGQRGESLASGVYFIRGVSADGGFTKTITILK